MALQEKSCLQNALENHLFQISLVPNGGSGIFNVSNECTNMWNTLKMMEEKEIVARQNSKEGLEKKENACIVERIFLVSVLLSDCTALIALKHCFDCIKACLSTNS